MRMTWLHLCSFAGLIVSLSGCAPGVQSGQSMFEDPFADYTRRQLSISSGVGNAQAVNLALQTQTPWPQNSNNTAIPANGALMVKSIRDFESGRRPSLNPSNVGGPSIRNDNASSGSGTATN